MGRPTVTTPDPANPDRAVSLAELDLGTWSADEGLAFEAAEWVLGALIAQTTAAAAAERAEPVPDQERLTALAEERAAYAGDRRRLSLHDPAHVKQVPTATAHSLDVAGPEPRMRAEPDDAARLDAEEHRSCAAVLRRTLGQRGSTLTAALAGWLTRIRFGLRSPGTIESGH